MSVVSLNRQYHPHTITPWHEHKTCRAYSIPRGSFHKNRVNPDKALSCGLNRISALQITLRRNVTRRAMQCVCTAAPDTYIIDRIIMSVAFPPLNAERLWARIERLSSFTVPDMPWTRRAFSPLFEEARAWLKQEFINAGLSADLDAAGNLVGRRAGRDSARKPIVTGSHCDTVMSGGRFDGIIGVLAGIEVAHTLNEQGLTLEHPFEVIDFLSEEPSDYGISCVGSRAL